MSNNDQNIVQALQEDEELMVYYHLDLSGRDGITRFIEQIKDLDPESIRNIVRGIQMSEDEEDLQCLLKELKKLRKKNPEMTHQELAYKLDLPTQYVTDLLKRTPT
jgi:hypothetical protein